jgi:hypothetical protein
LEESIALNQQALQLRPGSHPDQSSSFNNLPSALLSPLPAPWSPALSSPMVEYVATASKKRKLHNEVDSANIVEGTRSRRAPRRLNI